MTVGRLGISIGDIAGRRLRPDVVDSATAKQAARSFARLEQSVLDSE